MRQECRVYEYVIILSPRWIFFPVRHIDVLVLLFKCHFSIYVIFFFTRVDYYLTLIYGELKVLIELILNS